MDMTRRPAGKWVVDFGWTMSDERRCALRGALPVGQGIASIQVLHGYAARTAKQAPSRALVAPRPTRDPKHAEGGARASVSRYIATARRLPSTDYSCGATLRILPRLHQLIAIARDDDTAFGILHSRFHEDLVAPAWDEPGRPALATRRAPRSRRSRSPPGLSPNLPACRLRCLTREPWLWPWKPNGWSSCATAGSTPPEWVEWVDEPVPGYPKRAVPRDEDAAKALKKRTLTNPLQCPPAVARRRTRRP